MQVPLPTLFAVLMLLGTLTDCRSSLRSSTEEEEEEKTFSSLSDNSSSLPNNNAHQPEKLPEFISVLYNCWSRRNFSKEYEQCLKTVGEGSRISEIINSNTVTGFMGKSK